MRIEMIWSNNIAAGSAMLFRMDNLNMPKLDPDTPF
jgi:hypothetical protein